MASTAKNLHPTFLRALAYKKHQSVVIIKPTAEQLLAAFLTEGQYIILHDYDIKYVLENVHIVDGRVCTCSFGMDGDGCNVHNPNLEHGINTFAIWLHRHVVSNPQIVG